MRSLLIFIMMVYCTEVFATVSHYQCNEPQKSNGKVVTVDWSERLVSYNMESFVKAYKWTTKSIFWLQDQTVQKHSSKTSSTTISLHFNLVNNTLMYTVLDSKTVLPTNIDDWAKFLPDYLPCREFF